MGIQEKKKILCRLQFTFFFAPIYIQQCSWYFELWITLIHLTLWHCTFCHTHDSHILVFELPYFIKQELTPHDWHIFMLLLKFFFLKINDKFYSFLNFKSFGLILLLLLYMMFLEKKIITPCFKRRLTKKNAIKLINVNSS